MIYVISVVKKLNQTLFIRSTKKVQLTPEGEMLAPVRGYDLSVEGFVNFLQSGLDAYNK